MKEQASVLVVQETYGHMKECTLVKRFMKKGRVNVGREQTIEVKGCDQSWLTNTSVGFVKRLGEVRLFFFDTIKNI